ncbi:hypothetical protein FB45DRAFT_422193 [Roridomyces roridus]|uniref:Fungal-type protein kinase domain-containing protein n=1 Tax=Roridomyces roridus TaxID=1738132 RepID=A0AAD7FU84_9AGAR|nr:hypothetical protein FB45DRAFT_422193 [Roridomyces roridus]
MEDVCSTVTHGSGSSSRLWDIQEQFAALHCNDPAPRLPSPTSLSGLSLTLSRDPLSLMTGILHALLGWLSLFQAGFLHRDITIGNVMALLHPVKSKFTVDYALLGPEARKVLSELRETSAHIGYYDVEEQAKRLETLLAQLDVGAEARAFLVDSDLTTNWYEFPDALSYPRMGTAEFMSPPLLQSMEKERAYLHSPEDDLMSTAFVAQWAAVSHASGDHLAAVHLLRQDIREDRRFTAMDHLVQLTPEHPESDYGRFLNHLGPVFDDWQKKLTRLRSDVTLAKQNVDAEKLRLIFFTTAYRGVADFMEVMLDHKDSLAGYTPVEGPRDHYWARVPISAVAAMQLVGYSE